MKICFVRHGESQANIKHEISNRGLRAGLTRKGREQAVTLANRLRDFPITHIYSSPLLRAIETSVIIAGKLRLDYEVADALREYDCGILEGRSDDAAWKSWQELYDAWAIHRRTGYRVEGGESLADVERRFVSFIRNLTEQYGHAGVNLLCVGHGGLYRLMLPLILRNLDKESTSTQRGFGYEMLAVSELTDDGLLCREWL